MMSYRTATVSVTNTAETTEFETKTLPGESTAFPEALALSRSLSYNYLGKD